MFLYSVTYNCGLNVRACVGINGAKVVML